MGDAKDPYMCGDLDSLFSFICLSAQSEGATVALG
jgi:hypothetical protein